MYCKNCQKDVSPVGNDCPECGATIVQEEKTAGVWGGDSLIQNLSESASSNTAEAVPVNKSVGFAEAISLMFKNYFNFSGRACKSEYWWAFLFNVIVSAAIGGLGVVFAPIALLSIALAIPALSLAVRRLHDIGKNGWNILLGLIPIAGLIILIVYFVKDSDGDNRWGTVEKNTIDSVSESLEEKIYRLSQEHEPRNVSDPEGKKIVDVALSRIIPTYSPSQDLAKAIMLCDPHQIKDNIQAMDKDSLLIIVKGFRSHIDMGEDRNAIDMVKKNVINTLKEKL